MYGYMFILTYSDGMGRIVSRHSKVGAMVEEWERLCKRDPNHFYAMYLADGTRLLEVGERIYETEPNGANPLVYWH